MQLGLEESSCRFAGAQTYRGLDRHDAPWARHGDSPLNGIQSAVIACNRVGQRGPPLLRRRYLPQPLNSFDHTGLRNRRIGVAARNMRIAARIDATCRKQRRAAEAKPGACE